MWHVCHTHIQSTILSKSILRIGLPANASSAHRTETVGNPVWTKGVRDHFVEAGMPSDLRFKRIDHHVAINATDAAVADTDGT